MTVLLVWGGAEDLEGGLDVSSKSGATQCTVCRPLHYAKYEPSNSQRTPERLLRLHG